MENEEMQNQEPVNESVVQPVNQENAAPVTEERDLSAESDRKPRPQVEVTDEMVEKSIKHLENLLNYYNEVQSVVKNPKSLQLE